GHPLVEQWSQRRTCGLQGGDEPEKDPAQQRQCEGDQENVPVQLRVEREALLTVRQESRQYSHAPDRDQDPECTAERREEDTLRQKFPTQPNPPGTDAETNRQFPLARSGACQ